jgi:hypothetical protein
MASITRRWKKIVAVGCTHGRYICPDARRAFLGFLDDFRPAVRVHLGDFCDTTAFRAGAHGSADEAEDVEPDIDGGLTFLAEMGATHVLCGNHEDRLWREAASPNAVVAYAAGKCIGALQDHARKYRYELREWEGVHQRPFVFGGVKFLHGVMFGENATRDHAEAFGDIVHAHTHRPAFAIGRRDDSPIGICVGTLTRRREMSYAKARRATLAWGQGFVFGEYCETSASLHLVTGPRENRNDIWRLP